VDPKYPWSATFYGDKGTLKASVFSYDFTPRGQGAKPAHGDALLEYDQYPEDRTEKDLERHCAAPMRRHWRNFLDCIRLILEANGYLMEEAISAESGLRKYKEATPDLCNNKPIPIEAEITLRLGGKVTDASHDGKIVLGPHNNVDWNYFRGDQAVNNSSVVRWKVSLKSGETIFLSFSGYPWNGLNIICRDSCITFFSSPTTNTVPTGFPSLPCRESSIDMFSTASNTSGLRPSITLATFPEESI